MTTQTPMPPATPLALGEEALFREARRLRRRRWMRGLIVALLSAGVVTLAVVARSRGSSAHIGGGAEVAGILPNGPVVTLRSAGRLAVASDGALYVADVAADRVLVRVPDGRFRAVAGDGEAGFSGDGGRATRAELSGVSDLAFAKNGALYIADGGRVRVVSRDGTIRTIVGNGQAATAEEDVNP